MNQCTLVINDQYAGTGTGESDTIWSKVVPAVGNAVTGTVLVVNSSGTITITIKLQGSFEGVSWEDISNTTSSGGLDRKKVEGSAQKYCMFRLLVTVAGTTVKALIRAWIAQSSQ